MTRADDASVCHDDVPRPAPASGLRTGSGIPAADSDRRQSGRRASLRQCVRSARASAAAGAWDMGLARRPRQQMLPPGQERGAR